MNGELKDATNDDIYDALEGVVDDAAEKVNDELGEYDGNTGFKNYDFEEASNTVRSEIVSEFRTQLEKDVAQSKEAVEGEDRLLSKANTLVSAESAYNKAAEQLDAASNGLSAEILKFESLNSTTVSEAGNSGDFSGYEIGNVIEAKNGRLVITDDGKGLDGIDDLLDAAKAKYQGLLTEANAEDRLQASIKSVLKAESTETEFKAEFEDTAATEATVKINDAKSGSTYTVSFGDQSASVTGTTGGGSFDDASDIASGLASALGTDVSVVSGSTDTISIDGVAEGDVTVSPSAKTTLADDGTSANGNITDYYQEYTGTGSGAVTDGEFDAAVDLSSSGTGNLSADDTDSYFGAQKALNDFNDAVEDFQEIAAVQNEANGLADETDAAIEAVEEYDVEINDGGTGTEANDLFVFNSEEEIISGFGLQGDDQLYIGGDLTEVRADGDVTTDRLGDADTAEVFFQQNGNNAELYIEDEAFAGNAENANDLTKIELSNVNIDDLQFENGYVTTVDNAADIA